MKLFVGASVAVVAIKLLRSHGDDRLEDQARLLREAQAMAHLSHPNIIAVHDVGTYDAHELGWISQGSGDGPGDAARPEVCSWSWSTDLPALQASKERRRLR